MRDIVMHNICGAQEVGCHRLDAMHRTEHAHLVQKEIIRGHASPRIAAHHP
jgi:hypothetical protein